MRPGRLLRALAAIGLMLLPDERDALHLQRTPKDVALETRVHEQIAQLVPSFEVRSFGFSECMLVSVVCVMLSRLTLHRSTPCFVPVLCHLVSIAAPFSFVLSLFRFCFV
jgi:hypothetical protein